MKILPKKILKSRGLIYKIILLSFKKIFRFILFTNKIKIVDPDNIRHEEKAFFLMWHNRILMAPYFYTKKNLKNFSVIASSSKDGQIVSDYLKSWGVQSVFGSYGKSSSLSATKELIKRSNKNKTNSIAMAPDGPTGPKYKIKEGLVRMLGHIKAPIYIQTINYSKYWALKKTWDDFQIPKPFGTTTCTFVKAFDQDIKINKENALKIKEQLEKKMLQLAID